MSDEPDNLPALIEGLTRDIATVQTLVEVMNIKSRAEQVKVYTRGHKAAVGVYNQANAVVILCERKIGIELKKFPRNKGGQPKKNPSPKAMGSFDPPDDGSPPTLDALGFTPQKAAELKAMAEIDPDVVEKTHKKATAEGRTMPKADVTRNVKGTGAYRAARSRAAKPPKEKTVRQYRSSKVPADTRTRSLAGAAPSDALMTYRWAKLGGMIASAASDKAKMASLLAECDADEYTREIRMALPIMQDFIERMIAAMGAAAEIALDVAEVCTPATDEPNQEQGEPS